MSRMKPVGIVAVLVAAADLIDPLRQQVALGMGEIAGVTGIDHGCRPAMQFACQQPANPSRRLELLYRFRQVNFLAGQGIPYA